MSRERDRALAFFSVSLSPRERISKSVLRLFSQVVKKVTDDREFYGGENPHFTTTLMNLADRKNCWVFLFDGNKSICRITVHGYRLIRSVLPEVYRYRFVCYKMLKFRYLLVFFFSRAKKKSTHLGQYIIKPQIKTIDLENFLLCRPRYVTYHSFG